MTAQETIDLDLYLRDLSALVARGFRLPRDDSPTVELSRRFLVNTWETCRDGLLAKTKRIRVWPDSPIWPQAFRFEVDCPFKAKAGLDASVELRPGPVRGTVFYRHDLYANLRVPSVGVALDPSLDYFHPNFSVRYNLICLGELPRGPFPLDCLLENHLYPILTYQNRRPSHPANFEAAQYFALDPEAMVGLEPVEPLY
ncbi:MAG: hypothetical protein HUU20_14790 [Pirellulales bacterium]|nr:hypothetical protein [Pirellulales bacterium]